MTQPDLLTAYVPVRDSHVTQPAEVKRLAGQSLRIVQRLQQGPATNRELSQISLKYTSRCSDLKKAGYDIRAERGYEPGLWIYTLVAPEQVLGSWSTR